MPRISVPFLCGGTGASQTPPSEHALTMQSHRVPGHPGTPTQPVHPTSPPGVPAWGGDPKSRDKRGEKQTPGYVCPPNHLDSPFPHGAAPSLVGCGLNFVGPAAMYSSLGFGRDRNQASFPPPFFGVPGTPKWGPSRSWVGGFLPDTPPQALEQSSPPGTHCSCGPSSLSSPAPPLTAATTTPAHRQPSRCLCGDCWGEVIVGGFASAVVAVVLSFYRKSTQKSCTPRPAKRRSFSHAPADLLGFGLTQPVRCAGVADVIYFSGVGGVAQLKLLTTKQARPAASNHFFGRGRKWTSTRARTKQGH